MLFLEIILTIVAWRKGWKGWALLPVTIGAMIAFGVGLSMGASGATANDVAGVGVMCDIMVIVALIIMAAKAPKQLDSPMPDRARPKPAATALYPRG